MQETLKKLINLSLLNRYKDIYNILNTFQPFTKKGELFEIYLTELLNGNGYLAKHIGGPNDKGGDILLLDKCNAERIVQVIQAKNQKRPLTSDDLAFEIGKFNRVARNEYSCKFYSIYSLNGYFNSCSGYEEFNVKVNGWAEIKDLIFNYGEINTNIKIPMLPHNQTTFEIIKGMWEIGNKVCVIQATGTGKTYLIANAILEYEGKKIVLAPTDKILEQTSKKGIYGGADYYTYNKLSFIAPENLANMHYDLIVLDEFHRCGARKWGRAVALLLQNNPKSRVLGTTATPIRYDGSDMAEILFENQIAAKLSLPEAIVREILPQPKYIVALYEIDEVIKRMDEKVSMFDKENRIKNKYKKEIENFKIEWENARGMSTILKKHITSERKFIIFCKNFEHLQDMKWIVSNWFQKMNVTKSIKLYEATSHDKKNSVQQMSKFEKAPIKDNSFHLLFTINQMNEGLHISSVDGVILLRSTKSHRVYLQQLGRAFDANNKNSPLIFDLVNNFETLNELNFVKDIEEEQNEHNKRRVERKLEPKIIQFMFTDETKKILDYKVEFEKRLDDPWYWMYEDLVLFKEDFGHVFTCFMYDSNLKNWCNIQRENYKRGVLNTRKIKLLSDLGFHFSYKEDEWYSHFILAENHYKKYHQILVNHPDSKMMIESLRKWIYQQREDYKNGIINDSKLNFLKSIDFDCTGYIEIWYEMFLKAKQYHTNNNSLWIENTKIPMSVALKKWLRAQKKLFDEKWLSYDQQQLLSSLDFFLEDSQKLELMSKWREDENQARVEKYKQKKAIISLISTLKNVESEKKWKQQYDFINNFYTEEKNEGSLNINASFVDEDIQWLNKQRKDYKNGRLSKGKINLMEKLGFELDVEKEKFEKKALKFSSSPNSEKEWGQNIYKLYINNHLEDWHIDILIKYKIFNYLKWSQKNNQLKNENTGFSSISTSLRISRKLKKMISFFKGLFPL